MSSGFSIGLSGLRSNSYWLNVIGNNLANLNTTGYKDGVVSFQDMLGSSINGGILNANPMQLGMGSSIAGTSPVFTQGQIQNTSQATDLAIMGNGFFVVTDGNRYLYTRAGDFTLDKDGYLKTQQGLFLQGYGATQGVVIPGTLTNIQVTPGLAYPPKTTSYFMTNLNLNANDAVYAAGPPATGGIFSANLDVYDSLGSPHTLTITYTKTAANTWQYDVTIPADDVSGATAPVSIGNGSISFDPATGQLSSPASTIPPTPVTLTPAVTLNNGANFPTSLNWFMHDTDGTARITQFATKSSTASVSQDGYGSGSLIGIQVETSGLVQGVFSNGQYQTLGQVVLSSFHNPQGLSKEGQNLYAETNLSGAHAYGVPGAGGLGTLLGNSLEMSNVDMAEEFTKMILGQRGYQANSRVITTSDELIQEALNLKR